MDFKNMYTSTSNYKFMLVLLSKVSNFMVVEYTKINKAPEVCKVLFKTFIRYFGSPTHTVRDQDPAYMSSLCQYFFRAFGMKLITVSPTNHTSLLAEHGIKCLSNIMIKHLTGLDKNWDIFLDPVIITYNIYSTPYLDNLSPFEIALDRKAKIIPELEVTPDVPVLGTFKDAYITSKKITIFQIAKMRNKNELLN